jgi:hypothetical protein
MVDYSAWGILKAMYVTEIFLVIKLLQLVGSG